MADPTLWVHPTEHTIMGRTKNLNIALFFIGVYETYDRQKLTILNPTIQADIDYLSTKLPDTSAYSVNSKSTSHTL